MSNGQEKGNEVDRKRRDELDKAIFDEVFDPFIEAVRTKRELQKQEKRRLLRHVSQACERANGFIDKCMDAEGVKDNKSFQLRSQRATKALELAMKVLLEKVYKADDWQSKWIKELASVNRFKAGLAALRADVGSGHAALSKEELDKLLGTETITFFVKVSQSWTNRANAKKGKAKAKVAANPQAATSTTSAGTSDKEAIKVVHPTVSEVAKSPAQASVHASTQRGV